MVAVARSNRRGPGAVPVAAPLPRPVRSVRDQAIGACPVEVISHTQPMAFRHAAPGDDLIFAMPPAERKTPRLRAVPDPDELGKTDPSAYSAGRCRCEHCRASYAIYRAKRRGSGQDQPRGPRVVDTDGHIPRRWFRDNVWLPARAAAGLGDGVKVHSMRHAHASWLLAGGADLAIVKERLGHSSILATQKYLYTVPDWEVDAALGACDKIRNCAQRSSESTGKGKARGV